MKSKNCYYGVNPIVVAQIRFYTKYLKDFEHFAHEELEDIEQELLYQSWPYLSRYDETKGNFFIFANMVIKGRASNLMKKQQRNKYSGKPFSVLSGTAYPINEATIRIDVESIIPTLPEKWQDLCRQLKFFDPSDIAQMNKIARSTVYHILQKLRVKFKAALAC
ncbi:sigma-70 family RNA polymerase sigma factor [Wolbachia endosymbiont of Ctenocephalides felis wCfeT]|uniref:sigma-70 family RNA polymerase sigma factor n=1 Tax=Wolbachia endosymbiont of Ctenocephalides felis wCfeT TaxID=2732593 RepID=UPI00144500AB|nr:sigma-70 family RNA polymerase sigma factor [Wolbachia endosymbiont of Ctenocephalides felis wCfeT]